MKIHFIGIGGIGVSALARYYLKKGWQVSGSDLNASEITQDLERKGAKVFTGPHGAENLPLKAAKLIHSAAIMDNNPELQKARERGIEIQTYPQALGELTKNHFTIAIAGAHGKGTTTALISLVLIKAGFDPTVIIGTNLKEFGNANCRTGSSKYLIVEADEYQKAFLNYWPQIIVLTNIDKEHLDCYQDLDEIIEAFKEFIGHLPEKGILVANKDNENIQNLLTDPVFSGFVKNTEYYSLEERKAEEMRRTLRVPGEHNVSNALAALAVARMLKIDDKVSFKALSEYKGAWRRFELYDAIFDSKTLTVISDYAHHPTEIKATLQAAREKFGPNKIWAVFQPHQYQRTHYLFDQFSEAFDQADEIVITKIYSVAGREDQEIIEKTSGKKLAQAISQKDKKVHFIEDYQKIPDFLREKVEANDVILIMGGGSIYKIVGSFTSG